MSTKYVLNSGGLKKYPGKKRAFHLELIKGLGNEPHILLCNFAQGREYWEQKFSNYQQMIREDMPDNVKPTFKLAVPDTFAQDCQEADIIYLHGGDDILLLHWLRPFDLQNIWQGKVVATNSASSDAVSKYFWPCDWRKCMDGLGLLPIKFIPHYGSDWGTDEPRGPIDWRAARTELEEYGDPTLPIHTPEEAEYIVVEQ